jgi:hypothetical protein
MSINFIPNDPDAGSTAPAMRQQAPRPDRPAAKASFAFTGAVTEGTFAPGSPEFLFWQCREAALAAVEAWEASSDSHTNWQGNRKKLPLRQDAGEDLNAFYDRASVSFFHKTVGATTFFSGASTDVVSHEVGHGLLDSVRPDFWDTPFLEVGAFHEAFGDSIAILTALGDTETRQKLLAVTTDLRKRNFVESTAENLSNGIRQIQPTHNAAEPRHAFNTFQFQIPSSLPDDGGPGELIDEVHSFGMVFTGCFWDLIANLFEAQASKTEAALLSAARLAGNILIAGAKTAVVRSRFMQSVGRAMVLADQSLHDGANGDHIRRAFEAHGFLLGTNAMLAPTMALAGSAPKAAALAAATRKDLVQRLGGRRGGKLTVAAANIFGARMVQAVHSREVSLGDLDSRLKGVVAVAPESVMVGGSGGQAAVMGLMPHATDTEAEVQSFVKSLLQHDRIALDDKKSKKKGLVASLGDGRHATHAIRTVGGKKVLRRIRFRCACCA